MFASTRFSRIQYIKILLTGFQVDIIDVGNKMATEMQNLITEYVTAVKKIYGNHLKQVILYGSYARGDYTKDSDVDIMLLVDLDETELDTFSDALSELGFEYNVEHDIWMMPIVKNKKSFLRWSEAYPFYKNVKTEGISLYEAA